MSQVVEVVNPFDNFVTVHCTDCDAVENLFLSQWGDTKEGDIVCRRCETRREYEYGLPPEDCGL